MKDKILVVNGSYYARVVELFGKIVTDPEKFIRNPEQFKLVLFTGGEDVSPQLYGHTSPKGYCYNSLLRDTKEQLIFNIAVKHGIRMTGICRGSQFLNVMAGGTMIHHATGHAGRPHKMCTALGQSIEVTSTHHQMSVPPSDACIIGWSQERLSKVYLGDKDEPIDFPAVEVESVIFPDINAAVVQYHPEMMYCTSDGYLWYQELIINLLNAKSMDTLVNMYTTKRAIEF